MSKEPKTPYIDYDESQETEMPERRLLVAIIQRALIDYSVPVIDRPHLKYWASSWLFSDSKAVMSLFWICSHLSDDPEGFQSAIRRSVREKTVKKNSITIRVNK